jgi:hypothetical protein
MSNLLRSAVIAAIVLVAILVSLALGEGLCETCFDGCCVTAERFERVRTSLRRVIGSLGRGTESRVAVDAVLRHVSSMSWTRVPAMAIVEVSSLRI